MDGRVDSEYEVNSFRTVGGGGRLASTVRSKFNSNQTKTYGIFSYLSSLLKKKVTEHHLM
jgi:hypothetical protein